MQSQAVGFDLLCDCDTLSGCSDHVVKQFLSFGNPMYSLTLVLF